MINKCIVIICILISICVLIMGVSLIAGVSAVTVQNNGADLNLKIGEIIMFDGDTGCELLGYDKNYFTKTGNKNSGTLLKAKKTGTTKIKVYMAKYDERQQ